MRKTNLDNQNQGIDKLDDSDEINSEVCDTVRTNNAQAIIKDNDNSMIDETIDFVLASKKQESTDFRNDSFLTIADDDKKVNPTDQSILRTSCLTENVTPNMTFRDSKLKPMKKGSVDDDEKDEESEPR